MEKYSKEELVKFVVKNTNNKPFIRNMFGLIIYLQSCLNNKRRDSFDIYPFSPSRWSVGSKSPILEEMFEMTKEELDKVNDNPVLDQHLSLLEALKTREFNTVLYHMKKLPIISHTVCEYDVLSDLEPLRSFHIDSTIALVPDDKLTILSLLKNNKTKEKTLKDIFK